MEIIKTFTELKTEFEELLENSNDKKHTIDNELNAVMYFVNTEFEFEFPKMSKPPKLLKKYNLFILYSNELFKTAFNKYIETGKYNIERKHTDNDNSYAYKQKVVYQSFEFAEYYKWLRSLTNENVFKNTKKETLTIKQKLLALHYLGLNIKDSNNNRIAEIIAEVLGVGSENIRKSLSHLTAGKNNTVRTKNNLETVQKLFESKGLTAIGDIIKEDLKGVKK